MPTLYDFTGEVSNTTPDELKLAVGRAAFSDPDEPSYDVLVELRHTRVDIQPADYAAPTSFRFHPTTVIRQHNQTNVHGVATEVRPEDSNDGRPLRAGWLTLILSHTPGDAPLFELTLTDEALESSLPSGA